MKVEEKKKKERRKERRKKERGKKEERKKNERKRKKKKLQVTRASYSPSPINLRSFHNLRARFYFVVLAPFFICSVSHYCSAITLQIVRLQFV